jgi:biotin carboxyl carrier protein
MGDNGRCAPATERCRSRAKTETGVAEEIRAEMVANVMSVVVAEGARVCDGDTLVILESMKMEIPVISEVDGTVTKVAVTAGDVVQSGDLIAVVE